MADQPAVVLITGISAAGKSTVAQALAERLPRSVHVRGDVFRRMVVNGGADMTPRPDDAALRQLALRYQLTAHTADRYAEAGFTAVVQDVVLGEQLNRFIGYLRTRPRLVVVLAPRPEVVAARDARRLRLRAKTGYGAWTVSHLDAVLRSQTPRVGLWLDTSEQTVDETVEEILARAWTEAAIE
jgi:adenylylsulfate kinase-like enzyme